MPSLAPEPSSGSCSGARQKFSPSRHVYPPAPPTNTTLKASLRHLVSYRKNQGSQSIVKSHSRAKFSDKTRLSHDTKYLMHAEEISLYPQSNLKLSHDTWYLMHTDGKKPLSTFHRTMERHIQGKHQLRREAEEPKRRPQYEIEDIMPDIYNVKLTPYHSLQCTPQKPPGNQGGDQFRIFDKGKAYREETGAPSLTHSTRRMNGEEIFRGAVWRPFPPTTQHTHHSHHHHQQQDRKNILPILISGTTSNNCNNRGAVGGPSAHQQQPRSEFYNKSINDTLFPAKGYKPECKQGARKNHGRNRSRAQIWYQTRRMPVHAGPAFSSDEAADGPRTYTIILLLFLVTTVVHYTFIPSKPPQHRHTRCMKNSADVTDAS